MRGTREEQERSNESSREEQQRDQERSQERNKREIKTELKRDLKRGPKRECTDGTLHRIGLVQGNIKLKCKEICLSPPSPQTEKIPFFFVEKPGRVENTMILYSSEFL